MIALVLGTYYMCMCIIDQNSDPSKNLSLKHNISVGQIPEFHSSHAYPPFQVVVRWGFHNPTLPKSLFQILRATSFLSRVAPPFPSTDLFSIARRLR